MNSLNLFNLHCAVGFLVRILMIIFGTFQDEISDVKYTDIDYKVFTDAARHVLNGNSPYERYTYRYSPFVAFILIPNIIIHPAFGKLFFSICDILLCRFVWKLLKMNNVSEKKILWSVYFWLYNPVAIIISTRGNGDSLSSLIVLSTLLSLKHKNYKLAGFFHGISIHFRIYPIAFSLCMYLSIVDLKTKKKVKQMSTVKKIYSKLYPTYSRINLVFSCVVTLISVTGIFYYLYGYTFLFESLLYHIKRTDVRHNFSVFFYLQYLSSAVEISIIQKILMTLPQLVLILVISFVYGSVRDIYFCEFLIAFVMVTYNTVVTCQYFIWFLSLVPLIIPDLKFSFKEAVFTIAFWGGAQIGWLYPAYLLEFQNQNTFIYIWIMGLVFFCANIFAITRFIRWYKKSVKFD